MQNVIKNGRYWPPLAVIVNQAPITTDHPPFSIKNVEPILKECTSPEKVANIDDLYHENNRDRDSFGPKNGRGVTMGGELVG